MSGDRKIFSESQWFSRRDFLRSSGLGLVSVALGGSSLSAAIGPVSGLTTPGATSAEAATPEADVTVRSDMRYRMLGTRTGLRVSELGFGALPTNNPDVIAYAVDHGVNYIDTAACYRGGESERVIGRFLASRPGIRDKIVITTKWHPFSHHTKEWMLNSLDQSLKRLGTDYVDCLLVHQVGKPSGGESIERLTNPELFEAYEIAKRQGKIRFTGLSAHDGDMIEVMDHAIADGRFDVMLCRYSFLYPGLNELFDRARKAGMGIVVMKTLAGARGANIQAFRDKQTSFRQAALKWVWSNPRVSNLIISMSTFEQVDEYLAAVGQPLTERDTALLGEYERLFGREQCRFCNLCEPACPYGVPIADILRYEMYYSHYGEEHHALREYARLPAERRPIHCIQCAAPCLSACPYKISIPEQLVAAHRMMSC